MRSEEQRFSGCHWPLDREKRRPSTDEWITADSGMESLIARMTASLFLVRRGGADLGVAFGLGSTRNAKRS